MKNGKIVSAICAIAMTTQAQAQDATIYLCKSYAGGTFWSNAHCRQHNALIERIVSVPNGLPFQQQVDLAEQDRAAAAALTAPPTRSRSTNAQATAASSKQIECKALEQEIANWDAQARLPQSGRMQDWIASQREKARTRQFRLRC